MYKSVLSERLDMRRARRKKENVIIARTAWPYPFSVADVFTSKPEPENPIVKNPNDKPDLAEDPEKFEEPFVCLDILHAIIIRSQ
jgi:hypothetical protein